MAWRTRHFQGMQPRVAAHLLEPAQAARARNLWLTSGSLTPLRKAALRETIPLQAANPNPTTPAPVSVDPPDAPPPPSGTPGAPPRGAAPTVYIDDDDEAVVTWTNTAGTTDVDVRYRDRGDTSGDPGYQPGEWIDYPFSGTGERLRITGLRQTHIEVQVRFSNSSGASRWSPSGLPIGGSVLTVTFDNAALAINTYGDLGDPIVSVQLGVVKDAGGSPIREPMSVVHVSTGRAYIASRQASGHAKLYDVRYDARRITAASDLGRIGNADDSIGVRSPSAMAWDGTKLVVYDRDDGHLHLVSFSGGSIDRGAHVDLSPPQPDAYLPAGDPAADEIGGIDGMAHIGDSKLLMTQRTVQQSILSTVTYTGSAFTPRTVLQGNLSNPGIEGLAHASAGVAIVSGIVYVREEGTVANLAPRSGRVEADGLARVERFYRVTYDGVEIRQRRSLWDVPRDVGRPSGMTFIGRPPAPPQAPVVVRSGRNEIQETHVAPPAGGSAITGYERQHRQPGGEWSEPTPVAGLTSTISDLDDETEWEVRVRAVSALGAGPWSPPGRKELPDGIASTPVVSPGDDGELLVTFDPSPTERPRAPVLYYNVRFRKVQDGNWSLFQPRLSADGGYRVTGNGTGFRITGLTGVDYAVIVQPVNANGAGPWSAEGRGRRGYDRRLTKLETIHQADDLWFCFAQDVDVARGPVAHDTHNRHYWTGEDVPRMTTSTVLGNFANGLPPSRRLGVPSPARPGVVGPAELTDPDNATYHVWAMTFVTDIGEEGPPSLPSAVVERSPRSGGSAFDQATIHMACEAVGCPQATRKRLYRATGSVTRTSWRLVADMPIAQESYIDEKPDVDLGLELESTDWDPPPKDLKGLKVMANGMGVAFSGRDLYFSVPYQLHAWPGSQSLAFPDEIVALGVMGTSVVVLTKGNPYFVSGSTPASMQQDRIEYPQPCVSKRSVSGFGQTGILYASPDGLVRIGGVASADIVTRTMFSIREWRSRNPERIIGLHHDQAYVALREDGGFALDAQFNGLLEFDTQATSAYASADDDKLYYVVGNEIHEFAPADGSYHRGYWRSGTHRVARPVVYGAAEVFASEYPSALSGGTEVRWQEGVGFTLDGDPTSWIKAMKASSITFAAVDADGDSQADLLDAQEVGTLLVMRTDNAAIAWIVTSNSNRTMGLSRVWGRTLGHRSEAYPSDATVSFVFDHPGVLLEVFGDKTRRSAHFIESERPFRLPPGDPAVDWAFALSGAAEVMEANVGHMADLRR